MQIYVSPEARVGRTERGRIYVVDDDDGVRDSARALLESYDHIVEDFASARAFLDAFDELNDGCLLLDLNMPEMSGVELLELLREMGARIPVIVVTAQNDTAVLDRVHRAGVYAVVQKPVDATLIDLVAQAIR